jgi:hypothetical protein
MQGDLEESVARGQKFEDFFSGDKKVRIHTGEWKDGTQTESYIDAEVAV